MGERRHLTCYQSQVRGVQTFQKDKSEEQHCAYKEANKAAKRAVAMAKEEAYEELYTKLDTREGAKIILYKLAKSRDRRSRDLSDIMLRTNMEPS